jgi:hypothetical protein
VSQENVNLVLGLQLAPDVDLCQLFRDDDIIAPLTQAVADFFHPDFECAFCRFDTEKTYAGLDGLRALWLDWLGPWATYRAEIDEAIDLGDRVLLLTHDYGCREGSTQEVQLNGSAIWTVRDGKVACAEFYPIRREALNAAGLKG